MLSFPSVGQTFSHGIWRSPQTVWIRWKHRDLSSAQTLRTHDVTVESYKWSDEKRLIGRLLLFSVENFGEFQGSLGFEFG